MITSYNCSAKNQFENRWTRRELTAFEEYCLTVFGSNFLICLSSNGLRSDWTVFRLANVLSISESRKNSVMIWFSGAVT
jgi:hypothetical protein